MSIEGQGHFFTIHFPDVYVLCFSRPKYQVSICRTIGPLVFLFVVNLADTDLNTLTHVFIYKSGRSGYGNNHKFSDRQVWANSADPDKTAPRGAI